jgi:SAM-dependent methyltransferase
VSPDATTAETIASYEVVAGDYEARSAHPAPAYLELRQRFAALLPAASRIVDLGCGPGHDAAAHAAAGHDVVGLDLTTAMLRIARSRGVAVVRGDLRVPPIASGSVDGLWSSASLLHVPRHHVPGALTAWRALLREGGVLGLSTSLGDSEAWEDVPYATAAGSPSRPLRRWFVHHDRDQLLAALRAAGFTVVTVGERQTHRRWLTVLARAA